MIPDSLLTWKVVKLCVSNIAPSFLLPCVLILPYGRAVPPAHCALTYLLLSAWSYGFLLHAGGQNIFLSLFILMLDLSIFCHLGTSWPIHLYDLPPLSLYAGGSCFSPSLCTISVRATALCCPRQHPLLRGLSKWCPLELCSTQPRQPSTALFTYIPQNSKPQHF